MQKLYISFIILSGLLLPKYVFCMHQNNNIDGSYVTIKYQLTTPHFKNFYIKETDFDTQEPIGLAKFTANTGFDILKSNYSFSPLHQTDSYKSYQNDLLGIGLSVGLFVKSFRVEFEGSYKNFNAKRIARYKSKEGYKYFAIPRQSQHGFLSGNYTVAKNNGISIISNIINLCREAKYKTFTPYICIGVGGDFIEIFDVMRIKFAYQGKVGASYPITSKLILSINGQYHKVIGNKFELLPLYQFVQLKSIDQQDEKKDVTASLTLNLVHFSSEIGLSFTF
ncbi:P44/Msp2 family outer membrane protein [Ehrlichia chaffeensis]|uniref:P44/Msp2 family outer membrane protein n=1 Tax=Ehrlichia chaffeensis TaxID=945 RepID=UPI000444BFAE|nr:P44/Msp2 family outer membrane protein [Ehrlichia chaffeensis]AHX05153.1 surface antigen family protein [Ehrlichia chaffeensis str. Jax]